MTRPVRRFTPCWQRPGHMDRNERGELITLRAHLRVVREFESKIAKLTKPPTRRNK